MPPSSTKNSQVDVLIIGAGPSGLMAGNALAKAGINVRLVDIKPVPVLVGQADGIQPRTLEVLQSYGLAQRVLAEGFQMRIATFFEPSPSGGLELKDIVPDVRIPALATHYPYEFLLHQGGIEAIFLDSMKTVGVEVERPIEPTSIQLTTNDPEVLKDPTSHPVRVTLKNLNAPDEPEEVVHAKFVLGSDGAHSWVRKALDITMIGDQTDSVWGVIDIVPVTDFPYIRCKAVIPANSGTVINIPREGDKTRLYVQMKEKAGIDEGTGRLDKNKLGPDDILNVVKESFHPYSLKAAEECEWWTIYRVGQRVAEKFTINERIFISGDACHTHSPKAGQGMNASMNDTHNLAWKLAHVLRGWADISLLKTYEIERRKYAEDLINFDKEFAPVFAKKAVSHEEVKKTFEKFGGMTSGIGIQYPPCAIVDAENQHYAKNLVVGKRVPPQTIVRSADGRPFEVQELLFADTRFKLLIFTGDVLVPEQMKKARKVADELLTEGKGLSKFVPPGKDLSAVFDVLTISKTKLKMMFSVVNDLPKALNSHWTKVFVDDKDILELYGGNAYNNYEVDPAGVVVVVRPDGYVGKIAPFDSLDDLDSYFASFLKVSS
ncbi:hypothetical protein M378DRAFT_70250 [Amanita muscaria Koide BX008]|uniref:Phenol 2-monooxygenase n=1 Tax=Amanita muscaria (strain Koide BX008) TaxID=946122 RepID=A0A0C2XI19_AMAMK|nr:hypothetical protein M378DRAFT_70250 [Amanita muscaria Koide BX008]